MWKINENRYGMYAIETGVVGHSIVWKLVTSGAFLRT